MFNGVSERAVTMRILGVTLQRPTFWDATSAAAFGVALWTLYVSLGIASATRVEAGATLAVLVFGCVSHVVGVRCSLGWRHLVLNVAGTVVVLILYRSIVAVLT